MDISDALSTLKAVAAAKKPATLLAYLKEKNPELAKKTEETAQNLRNVLTALKRSKVDVVAQRKAAAMQKVARIKAAIQALKMSAIVDPKMIAKMAAKLAKELAAAVKEYAGAGGNVAAIGGGDTSISSASGEENAPETSAENSSEGQEVGQEVRQEVEQQAANPTPLPQAIALEKSEKSFAAEHDSSVSGEKEKHVRAYETRQSGGNDAGNAQDAAFKKDVEDVIEELRKLIRQHKSLVKDDKDKAELEEAEKSLKEAEKVLATLNGGASTPLSLSINT